MSLCKLGVFLCHYTSVTLTLASGYWPGELRLQVELELESCQPRGLRNLMPVSSKWPCNSVIVFKKMIVK